MYWRGRKYGIGRNTNQKKKRFIYLSGYIPGLPEKMQGEEKKIRKRAKWEKKDIVKKKVRFTGNNIRDCEE